MLKLYCFPRSGNSREVKIVLAEKNIPYEKKNIRDEGFDKENPEFKKASPRGTVPAIIDEDVYMSEAYLINEYLEKKHPSPALLPSDEGERGAIRAWVARYDKTLALKIGLLIIETLLKPKDKQKEETKEKLRGGITQALAEMNADLGEKEYLFGAYSLADTAMTPHLAALGRVSYEIPAKYTCVKSWLERIRLRPSFEKSAG